jgi:uncharacterized delta-60 repeat protein
VLILIINPLNKNIKPQKTKINQKTMKFFFAIIAFLLHISSITYGQVGTIDASFGTSGAYTFAIPVGIDNVEAKNIVVLPNDQIVVATNEKFDTFLSKPKLTKLTANGAIDATFGTAGIITIADSTYGYSNVMLMPNGKLLAYWHKNVPNVTITDDYPFVTMHNADGSFVATFGSNGRLNLPYSPTGGTIEGGLAADANNNIYVMYDYNGGEVIRSYTNTGAINTTFGNNGALILPNDGTTQMVYSPTSGGRLLLAGYDINDNLTIGQYLLNGQLDFAYASAGYATIPYVIANPDGIELSAIALQDDGKLLVHTIEYNSTQATTRVSRINTNGTLDIPFNNNAVIATASLTAQIFLATKLVQQTDSKIVLGGGNIDLNADTFQKAFFRMNSNGTFDNTFGNNGLLSLGTFNGDVIYDVKLQSTGKIVSLVGNDANTNATVYLIRLLNNLNIGTLGTLVINELGLYPNPVQSSFELNYELKEPQNISIYLIDAQGRAVHSFQENKKENGAQTHKLSLPASITSGIYIVSIRSGSSTNNVQIIVK